MIKTLCIIAFLISHQFCNAQFDYYDKEQKKDEQKKILRESSPWRFGGNFWFNIGTRTYIDASPILGYQVSPRFLVGCGAIYRYDKYQEFYETSSYGGKVLLSYALIPSMSELFNINMGGIILQLEEEVLNVEKIYPNYVIGERIWTNNLLIGAGLTQPIGGRSSLYFVVLFNLTENKYSPYSNPVLRFGITL